LLFFHGLFSFHLNLYLVVKSTFISTYLQIGTKYHFKSFVTQILFMFGHFEPLFFQIFEVYSALWIRTILIRKEMQSQYAAYGVRNSCTHLLQAFTITVALVPMYMEACNVSCSLQASVFPTTSTFAEQTHLHIASALNYWATQILET